jgi:hypothetical protein
MNCKVYNSTNAGKNKPKFQFFSCFCTIPVSKSLKQCCGGFWFIFEHVLAKNATYSRYILATSNPPYAKSIHTRLYLIHTQLLLIHTRLHLTHNRLHFFPQKLHLTHTRLYFFPRGSHPHEAIFLPTRIRLTHTIGNISPTLDYISSHEDTSHPH